MLKESISRHAVLGLVAAVTLFGCGGAEESAEVTDESLVEGQEELFISGEEPNSLAGLPGSYSRYAWLAPAEELVSVTLTGIELGGSWEGTYVRKIKRTCREVGCDIEQGKFYALPTNPASGFSFILFTDENDQTRDAYVISRLYRNAFTGRIQSMTLGKLNEADNTTAKAFTVSRVGF